MKFIKTFCVFVLFCSLGVFGGVAQADDPAIEALISASKARAKIVKRVNAAVVHIRVEKLIKGQNGAPSNPYDLFNDEFFDRFFPGQKPPGGGQVNPDERRRFRQDGLGSGAILDKAGYIITNHHVVGEADKIIVRLSHGKEVEAKLVGTDPPSDIAVIKIDEKDLKVLKIGNSDDVEVGESVIAIGNPFGLSQTVTFGIISAKGRSGIGITDYENFIQTDAAINPGNSGGPLINLRGEIIGVNTAIFTRSGAYNGIGFAVPSNMAIDIMNDLVTKGAVARGWLGVGIQNVDDDTIKRFDLEEDLQGSVITSVMIGTPAETAGIEVGDVVIGLNAKPITDSNQFRNKIALARAHAEVELELIRKGQSQKLKVTLGERPTDTTVAQRRPEVERFFGMMVEDITPENSAELGYKEGSGVIISEIAPESAAARAGLEAGHLIKEVDRTTITQKEDFREAMSQADGEEGILFLVQTQQGTRYIIMSSSE